MTLFTRLVAIVLLPPMLALGGGVERGCTSPGDPIHPATAHHGSHGADAPAPTPGHHSCPSIPGAPCPGMTACHSVATVPAPVGTTPTALQLGTPPHPAIAALLTRDITPDSPPPRA